MHGIGGGVRRRALRLGAAFFGLLAASSFPDAGQAATQAYVVTGFDTIRLDAPVRVVIRTNAGASARGEGDRDALDRVRLTMSGTTLIVWMDAPGTGGRVSGPVTLTLTTSDLRRIMLSGGGAVTVDRIKGERGEIFLAGGGDISVGAVALDRLAIILSGSGRLSLAGTAGVLTADISGPGALEAEELKARQATIMSSGPGTASLTAVTTAAITARGSGAVTVAGTAACKVDRLGVGTISCGGKAY